MDRGARQNNWNTQKRKQISCLTWKKLQEKNTQEHDNTGY